MAVKCGTYVLDLDKLISELNKGVWFYPRIWGIRYRRTIEAIWVTEFEKLTRSRHLFGKKASKISSRPTRSSIRFALNFPEGWWTTETLFKLEIDKLRDRMKETKARFLHSLADRFFWERFKEITGEFGVTPEEAIRRIRLAIPWEKRVFNDLSKSRKIELGEWYADDIEKRIISIANSLRRMIPAPKRVRGGIVKKLDKELKYLKLLNVAEYMVDLVDMLEKMYYAITDYNRRAYPFSDLDIAIERTEGRVKASLQMLRDVAKVDTYWKP